MKQGKETKYVSLEHAARAGMSMREMLIANGAKEDDLYPEQEMDVRFKNALLKCLTTKPIQVATRK